MSMTIGSSLEYYDTKIEGLVNVNGVARWPEVPVPKLASLSQQLVTVLQVYKTLSIIHLLFSPGSGARHLGSIGGC